MTPKQILVTGAAGNVGSVGFKIVEVLRAQGQPVRAMVHRIDARSEALVQLGAEVVVGDLTELDDMHRVIEGCSRIYFGMAAAANYLEATLDSAAVAKFHQVEVLVNISQLTVSQMDIHITTPSTQQKFHWLAEQALNWSGLPVVHLRATVFLEHFFFREWAVESIRQAGEIRLPFGNGRTSPIATIDVARVAAAVLINPASHIGKVYELTGPRSQDMNAVAAEYSAALGRSVKYVDVDLAEWEQKRLKPSNLPEHVMKHFVTMAQLHKQNRYDRMSDDVERVTRVKPITIEEWVRADSAFFQG